MVKYMRRKNFRYCNSPIVSYQRKEDKPLTKEDIKILSMRMKMQQDRLDKIDKQSSFWSGVAQNITGDAIFEVVLRGMSKIFKI